MIYLSNTTERQSCHIPVVDRKGVGVLSFGITGTMTDKVYEWDLPDTTIVSNLYHLIDVELPGDVSNGEYVYCLADEQGVLSTGLLVIGDLQNPQEYNKAIEYEQYED